MGRQRTEEPMLDTDPRRKPGKKLLDATMVVKWAIIKLLITMHLAMPADIFAKAVDLETHTKMRNLMMTIPWATAFYRRVGLPPEREAAGRKTSSSNTEPVLETNTAKLTRLVKAFNEPSRAWREVMNKEGDVPEAVGMLCQSDLRLRL